MTTGFGGFGALASNTITTGVSAITAVSDGSMLNRTTFVHGPVECSDVVIEGVSLKERLEILERRMSIIIPDPTKIEKYEALKRAYEHYKTLEALLYEDN